MINIMLHAITIPVVLFEYFVLLWFWGGSDIFNLISTPIVYIAYLIIIILIKKKIKPKNSSYLLIEISSAIILPILTMATVWLLALFLGVEIVIW